MFCSLVRVLILMCACVEGALVVVKGDRNVWGSQKLRGNAISDGPFFETNSFTLDFGNLQPENSLKSSFGLLCIYKGFYCLFMLRTKEFCCLWSECMAIIFS